MFHCTGVPNLAWSPVKLHVPLYRDAEPSLVPCKTSCFIVQGRRTLLDPPVIGSISQTLIFGREGHWIIIRVGSQNILYSDYNEFF